MTPAFLAYSRQTRFGALDGLRALAISAVLFHHTDMPGWLMDGSVALHRGFLGVDLFFVISGFLITTLLLRERDRTGAISLRGFYWRRALRILPLYLLIVTAVGAYYVLLRQDAAAAQIWSYYYVFMVNFLTYDIQMLGPMWSLSVEEQYYLIWPLLLILLPARAILPVLGALIAANVLISAGVFGDVSMRTGPLLLALPFPTYAPILMGSALAVILNTPRGFAMLWPLIGARAAAPVLAVLIVALTFLLPEPLQGWPNLVMHLAMTALVGALIIREDTVLSPGLRFPPLARIGVVSYGIYLLHPIVHHFAAALAGRLGLEGAHPIYLAFYWGGSWAAAELSFRLFETPFLRLRHGRSRPAQPLNQDGART